MPFVDWKILPKPGELIWVESEEPPFNRLGRIGVYASGSLSSTHFNQDWQAEMSSTVVDNVNLLYVAFTRAEEELYLFGPEDKGSALNRCHKLVLRSLSAMGHSAGEDGSVSIGEKCATRPSATTKHVSSILPSYPSNKWQDKIRISTKADRISELLGEKKQDKARFGVIVHDVIAAISNPEEIDAVLERQRFEGLISEDEKYEVRELVVQVMEHPVLKGFFDTDWEVKREQEILTPEAKTLRPDRVLVREKEAILIDFKTGKQHEAHWEQVLNYADKLTGMGYEKVKKYLVYLPGPEVVEVTDGLDKTGS